MQTVSCITGVVKSVIPVSRRLSGGATFPEALDHFSSSSPLSLLIPTPLPECPTCKQERKIRKEYDKFIIQMKKDRDGLSVRVTQLENELRGRTTGQKGSEKTTGNKSVQTENEEEKTEEPRDNRREKTGGEETDRAQKKRSVGENDDDVEMESTGTTQEVKTTEVNSQESKPGFLIFASRLSLSHLSKYLTI